MPKVTISGFKEYEQLLDKMSTETVRVLGEGIYAGANILANQIKHGIQGIRTEGPSKWEEERREKQKQALIHSFGIAPMQESNGFLNVKLGFEGYNDIKTPTYPGGQPNAMVARMYNSGTSVLSKQGFFDKSVRAAQGQAKKTAVSVIEEEIDKILKG